MRGTGNFNHIFDGYNDVEIAAVELLEAVVMFCDFRDWHERFGLGPHFRCDDGGQIRDKPFAGLLFSSPLNYVFELAIGRLLKLLNQQQLLRLFVL